MAKSAKAKSKKRTFEEVDFSDDDGAAATKKGREDPGEQKPAKRQKVKRKGAEEDDENGFITIITPDPPPLPASSSRPDVRFHQPTDPDFSPIAIPVLGENANCDWREWQSPKCRCLKCEILRVAPLMKRCRVVVLLDIDNWGLDPLAKRPRANLRLPDDCFFWCFYGLGFEKFEGVDLGGVDFAAYAARHGVVGNTVFTELQQSKRVWFSPAGGHSQAADEAIIKTVAVLRNMHVAVITGDRELGQTALQQKRSPPLDGKPRRVGLVTPAGRPFNAVWRELLVFYDQSTGGTMW